MKLSSTKARSDKEIFSSRCTRKIGMKSSEPKKSSSGPAATIFLPPAKKAFLGKTKLPTRASKLVTPPFVSDIPRRTERHQQTIATKSHVSKRSENMAGYNIFYIIGVVVVVLFILGYLGLR